MTMIQEQQNDLSVIERFKCGETSAFEEIVLKHQDRIYTLCRRLLGNAHDAEDAAQDTFIKAYKKLGAFRPDAAVYTWLYRIAINTCLDFKRKPFFESLFPASNGEEEFRVDYPSADPTPEMLCDSKQNTVLVHKGLCGLSEKLRAAIVLRELEGLSYEEIAAVLDISIGTVKSRISLARQQLKTVMNDILNQCGNGCA